MPGGHYRGGDRIDYNVRVRKRGKGYQYIVSYKVNGEWKTKSKQGFKKAADAKTAGQAVARDLSAFVPSTSVSPTFKEVALLSHLDGVKSESTIKTYNSYLNAYEPIHHIKVDELKYQEITTILQEYRVGRKFNSLKAVHRYGKMVMNYAVKKLRAVNRNIFDDYVLAPPKQSDIRPVQALTVAEICVLIDKMTNPSVKLVVAVIGLCGLRVSEAIALTRADIKDGRIIVSHQLQHGNLYAELKTANSYREVPIPQTVKDLVNQMPMRMDGRICCVSAGTVNKHLNVHGLSSHHLRHSYATNLIGMGVDFRTAAALLGDTVAMVMSTYSHVNADMMKEAEKKILENF